MSCFSPHDILLDEVWFAHSIATPRELQRKPPMKSKLPILPSANKGTSRRKLQRSKSRGSKDIRDDQYGEPVNGLNDMSPQSTSTDLRNMSASTGLPKERSRSIPRQKLQRSKSNANGSRSKPRQKLERSKSNASFSNRLDLPKGRSRSTSRQKHQRTKGRGEEIKNNESPQSTITSFIDMLAEA